MWRFDQISQSYTITKFWIQCKWRHTRKFIKYVSSGFLCFFVSFKEKTPLRLKSYSVFDHFSWTYDNAKFWMIKLYRELSNAIHVNECTKYTNCGLHLSFWIFLLMSVCLLIKKGHFKQKLLPWLQVPFETKILWNKGYDVYFLTLYPE